MEFKTDDYTFQRWLASGRNGGSHIFEVSFRGKRCALKRIVTRTARDLLLTQRERDSLVHINHSGLDGNRCLHGRRFFVRLIRAIQTSPIDFHLLFPLAVGGDLFEQRQLRPNKVFSELEARHYLAELTCALKFLHVTCQIIHRDIKTENVLLDGQGHVLLSDFDLATRVDPIKGVKHEACGTLETVAPECVPPICETSYASDIYALGMLAMELVIGCSRKIPHEFNEDQAFEFIARGERETCDGRASHEYSRFVNCLLQVNASNRPSASQLRNMPFFECVNGWPAIEWEKVLRRKSNPPKLIFQNTQQPPNESILFGLPTSVNNEPGGYEGQDVPGFYFEMEDDC